MLHIILALKWNDGYMSTHISINIHNVDYVTSILLHISNTTFRKCIFIKINNSLEPEAILSFYKSQWENKNSQLSIDDLDWKPEHFFLRYKSQNNMNKEISLSLTSTHELRSVQPMMTSCVLTSAVCDKNDKKHWDSQCLFCNGLLLWDKATGFSPGYKEAALSSSSCPGHNSLNANLQLIGNCS